jgi:spore maturation protein CgeB
LRVFYAAGASPNAYGIRESRLWKHNLFDTLVEMGHEVIPFSRDVTWHLATYQNQMNSRKERDLVLKYKAELQASLLEEIGQENDKAPVDLLFSYFWSDICDPETIVAIKRMGILTVNWYCNASYQFQLVQKLAPAYHHCLVPERMRLDDYSRAGANPIYCQEAANPTIYRPYELPVSYDVVFIGQNYGNRPAYLERLAGAGVDVWAFGPGWTQPPWYETGRKVKRALLGGGARSAPNRGTIRRGGVLSDLDYVQMYSRCKIALGFTTTAHAPQGGEPPIKQVRLRDFEAPMSGAFYMVEFIEELSDFFKPGEEIVFFSDPDDLIQKAQYYLHHEDEREGIRQAGMNRARKDHSWRSRFEKAFREMGLA